MNYLSQDRLDISYAGKEISRMMSAPGESDEQSLKRIIRYLQGHRRMKCHYLWQEPAPALWIFTDSDWAGCTRTRRSTSGGVATLGGHWLGHWSRTQPTIALSSGEAELNASNLGASEGLGLKNIMRDLGDEVDLVVLEDSSASIGIGSREGTGRIKHLETRQLWIQEKTTKGDLELKKIPRAANFVDSLTHNYTSVEAGTFLPKLGFEFCN